MCHLLTADDSQKQSDNDSDIAKEGWYDFARSGLNGMITYGIINYCNDNCILLTYMLTYVCILYRT